MTISFDTYELNTKIRNDVSDKIAEEIISKINDSPDLTYDTLQNDANIVSELNALGYKINSRNNDEQIALQKFLYNIIKDYKAKKEQKIQFNIKMQIVKLGLKDTENPEFKIDNDGKYFKLENNEYKEQKEIL
jgi:hypothetical protein